VCLRHDVVQVLCTDDRVSGVRVRDKASGEERIMSAPLVVSDIGPRATQALLNNRQVKQADVLKKRNRDEQEHPQEAIGLKVHILSDVSLIPHKGIMYCLDTRRIAGMVQPTNCDPRLAPAGKHLLISHQVMRSDDIEEEKALALADLRMLFGETFEKHCRILTMSAYRGEWPVNRIAQGEDVAPGTDVQGLYLVGDAVKPTGYLMVEGVAQSVNRFLDLCDSTAEENAGGPYGKPQLHPRPSRRRLQRERSLRPSRLNALHWLWEAPGNSGKA
jgi:phytoene dehydrogenase-like protein